MPKITHISLKVADAERTSRFYEAVFGFTHVHTVQREGARGGHISRHLTDGTTDLTLMQYESEQADEADFAGPAPCIHHFGIEVDDVDAVAKALTAAGAEILSAPGKLPVKFRAPGGPVAEIVPRDRYKKATIEAGTHGAIVK